MLHWRLLIGIPLVAFLIGLCWLDSICPIPGLVLIPFYLTCVFFLCRETLQLLRASGIYPRRTTVYLGVFGTIILCWLSCYNSLPFVSQSEELRSNALNEPIATVSIGESNETLTPEREASLALQKAKQALEDAELALDRKKTAMQTSESDETTNPTKEAEKAKAKFSREREWQTATHAGMYILLAIAAGIFIAFIGEMLRFQAPGGNLINLTGAIFAIVYIGLLGAFMLMLRMAYGIMAVVSMIVVAKICDIGAYTVGRLIGKHKMAPSLSPGKTVEGILGGLAFSIFGAWLSITVLLPLESGRPSETTFFGIALYGVLVGAAGAIGDLAESFIKRDAMRKDSGTHVPGFGGFLDIFDSLLIAAPVAFALWAFHIIR